MTDITAVTSLLGSLKTAIDIAKLITASDLSLEKAETKLKFADLISALANARVEVAGLQNLISEKDEKIKKLEEALEIKQKLRYEAPYYWLVDDSTKEGPFCQVCYDTDRKLIHLQGNREGYWCCKVCKNDYTDSSHRCPKVMSVKSKFRSGLKDF
ncbi:MAG: hypothetical protein JSV88_01585 [Candidatus Aminicenantes bacterium]|nr:MAG: hypothetical protein JSV88_01585 [Candidatus Aminicenantes bacterium]